jgi:2-amino-4-hydroxy-6-hydroxymethyldihydropteridine diphosphokinase
MPEIDAWIGLGSNLDDPVTQLGTALTELDAIDGCRLQASSSLYASPPMGPADQPDYVNAVVRLKTTLPPLELLDALQAIEQRHERRRERHWGPRTLDLDLLLYAQAVIDNTRLTVPHPGIGERNFVLYPLAELDRTLVIPGLGVVEDLLDGCPAAGLRKLEKP